MARSSVSYENFEFYHASPSSTPSATDTSGFSVRSDQDSFAYCRTNSELSSVFVFTEESVYHDPSSPLAKSGGKVLPLCQASPTRLGMKQYYSHVGDEPDAAQEIDDIDLELDMMREKYSKLLLGEDMSGGGKGVCSAVALSNSITNLYATVFGQTLRLAPLPPEKKSMWKREMDWLLSVCDYIVEFVPATETFKDGTPLEVMTSRLRSDIYMSLPALKKLDNMLLDILESFRDTEFWYAEQGSMSKKSNTKSGSFRKTVSLRTEEKWWLPVPCVPAGGISEKARKHLQHKRDNANQIHKAAMAINNSVLGEMEVPEAYMSTLPKSGRACLGDSIYRHISGSEKFVPEYLLDNLNISSEHEALEIADKVEAAIYIWKRKVCISIMPNSKSTWNLKDLVNDGKEGDKNHILAGRAESLLLCLKQRYPGLSQTTLDTTKIQDNKDVGQGILESYSRVLEGLAFNVVSWVDDVLYVDDQQKNKILSI